MKVIRQIFGAHVEIFVNSSDEVLTIILTMVEACASKSVLRQLEERQIRGAAIVQYRLPVPKRGPQSHVYQDA